MPKKDIFHDIVKEAFEKEGWIIVDEHYKLKYGKTKYFVDLALDKMLAIEKGEEKILVEIKSFVGKSIAHDYHETVGQYRNYLLAMKLNKVDRILFLAVPEDVYNDFFLEPFGQASIQEENLRLVVFNPTSRKIVKWIK